MKRISSVLLTICATAAIAVTAAAVTAAPPAPTDDAVTARGAGATMDDDDEDLGPCKHGDFKTQLVKDACAEGGQLAAKQVMKRFVKDAKKKLAVGNVNCNTCHDELAPEYTLKDDGLARFEEWQKRLAAKKAAPAE
ncbi:MAG: hypothetical protein CVU56_16485 [Deltaproteobacteria bacterium HGW-Deltaproteobacteria-14]|jgi:hypothetical protein|nr:MAG: hypothetical protein CVU56_16485 [Deltaproteobacteria bacterium HGW-Deltaproteobacteria-14]